MEENLDEIETTLDSISAHMSEEEYDYLDLIIAAITYDHKYPIDWDEDE